MNEQNNERDEDDVEFYQCPACGSENVDVVGGDWIMNIGEGMQHYTHWKCYDCAHWWQIQDEG